MTQANQVSVAQDWQLLPSESRDVQITQRNGVWDIQTTGRDPFLVADLVNDSELRSESRGAEFDDVVLEMDCFAISGVKGVEVYLGPPFSKQVQMDLPPIPVSETWATYRATIDSDLLRRSKKRPKQVRLDLGRNAGVRLQIRGLRFRPMTAADRKEKLESERAAQEREDRAAQIGQYLQHRFPNRIEDVVVSFNEISLSGKPFSGGVDPSSVQIIECPPWTDVTSQTPGSPVGVSISVDDKTGGDTTWRATVPRYDGKRDRSHSSWRLAIDGQWISSRRFPTTIRTVGKNHVVARADSGESKGLGGITQTGPLDELPELGITAITVNLVLGSFLSNRPGPGRELIPVTTPAMTGVNESAGAMAKDSEPVYFSPEPFKKYDVVMNFARKNNMVVSAILLVPTPRSQTGFSPLVHPENDGGVYSMPNLTESRAPQLYAFVLNRLARRYSNPTAAPGGVTNWIVHNEVDHHKQWTNMGSQPRALVIEAYYRSMRMIDTAARTYNPHARVFASLTHSWVVPDDGKGDRLAPRDVLVALQRYSALEGDFPWGVAYHPYPQGLFFATAWNDKIVTDDFDTPMVTMQNIEVLERFMAHPLMRDSSKQPRAILLSEQGFHTDSYDAEAQANQAGSLAYAMSKIKKMKTVESFHYHRWIDNPNEGGLLMGLRTLPTKQARHGEKKRAWYVYQAIDTPQESEVTQGLPGPGK